MGTGRRRHRHPRTPSPALHIRRPAIASDSTHVFRRRPQRSGSSPSERLAMVADFERRSSHASSLERRYRAADVVDRTARRGRPTTQTSPPRRAGQASPCASISTCRGKAIATTCCVLRRSESSVMQLSWVRAHCLDRLALWSSTSGCRSTKRTGVMEVRCANTCLWGYRSQSVEQHVRSRRSVVVLALILTLIVTAALLTVGQSVAGAQTGGSRCTDASNSRQRSPSATNGSNFSGDTFRFESTFGFWAYSSMPDPTVDGSADLSVADAMSQGADGWDGYRTQCTGTIPDGGAGWTQFGRLGFSGLNPVATGDQTNMIGWVNFAGVPAGTNQRCSEFLNSAPGALGAACLFVADRDTNTSNDNAYLWEYGIVMNYNSDAYRNRVWTTNMNRTVAPWLHVQATMTHEFGHVIGLAHPAVGASDRLTMDTQVAAGIAQRERFWVGNGDMWGSWDRK